MRIETWDKKNVKTTVTISLKLNREPLYMKSSRWSLNFLLNNHLNALKISFIESFRMILHVYQINFISADD